MKLGRLLIVAGVILFLLSLVVRARILWLKR
jgi:hypothetical protein